MEDLRGQIRKIDKRLEEVARNVIVLQDFLLHLISSLEAVIMGKGEREILSQITMKTSEGLDKFRRERPPECAYKDFCTRRVEKAVFKVIQAFTDKGANVALREARLHAEAAAKHFEDVECPDDNCFKNIIDTFKGLEELIDRSRQVVPAKDLYSPQSWHRFDEIREEDVANKLAPVSNPTRIRILKVLSKGGKNYVQLERLIGIRGGHLQFHLKNLMEAGYVTQEKPQGKYMITYSGLKILKFLCELAGITEQEVI